MAEQSGFFNSSNGDRKYKADFFAKYFSTFISNGVFPNPSTNLQIIANNDMTVTVKTGPAWINGYIYINDSDLILPIDVADGVLNRIDRIVVQYNTVDRAITAKVKKGAFASSPVALDLQRDADAYELGIADIYIAAGATSIIQANITDLRLDTTKCGVVTGTIDQVDTTTIFNQYMNWLTTTQNTSQTEIDNMEAQFQSDWNTWFTSVQNALSGDTAGNLLNMINELASHLADDAYQDDIGTTNTYVITLNPAPTVYKIGQIYRFKALNANTGASTLNVNGLGVKTIKKNVTTDLAGGDIVVGQIVTVVYDGTNFQFIGVTQAERTTWNGKQNTLGYTPVQQGTGVGQLFNVVKIGWNGSRTKITIDATDMGNIAMETSGVTSGTTGLHRATMSTSAPSGGSDGDVWLQYV